MIVGVPKEIKSDEYRVAMIPAGVEELTLQGHRVLVQSQAGVGSGLFDEDYRRAGAEIIDGPADIFSQGGSRSESQRTAVGRMATPPSGTDALYLLPFCGR